VQIWEPLVIGQVFFGAVISEQAVTTTDAMMAATMRRLRRTIGVLLTRDGRR
jgi:hypothetical protein